jgi:hypothetical protein
MSQPFDSYLNPNAIQYKPVIDLIFNINLIIN